MYIAKVVTIQKLNLANSGYMPPDMKVEKKNQDPSIFLATYWNLL